MWDARFSWHPSSRRRISRGLSHQLHRGAKLETRQTVFQELGQTLPIGYDTGLFGLADAAALISGL